MRWRNLPWVAALLGAVALSGCGGSRPEVASALNGTLPDLEHAIAQAEKSGPLTGSRLRDLAHAVAEREIAGAQGRDGADEIDVFRPCLPELEAALDERAERGDETAAAATMLLVDAGKRSTGSLVSRYEDADSGAFRALAARSALSPTQAELRRRFYTDPDERVRRAAFDAAIAAPFPAQLADLVEAARLDPSPMNRSRAAQAVGRIGSERAVLGLLDLYSAGDEDARMAVLSAWSDSAMFRRGGEREISRALSQQGMVSVSAASLLLRSRDSRAAAIAVLAHAIADGSDDEKRLALMMAPLGDASVRDALNKAAKDPSPELTPLVLTRLIEIPSSSKSARERLEKLASDKNDSGLEANYALVRLGSLRAVGRVEQELSSEHASRRLRAAITLASLGKTEHLAPRLADRDPWVRASLACQLSSAPSPDPVRFH
jgi:HEAT repeat protein